MAYVGFSCLCGYLWTSPDPLLSAKPVQWIKDLIDLSPLQSLAQLLNITRRSAGLPFYCLVSNVPPLSLSLSLSFSLSFIIILSLLLGYCTDRAQG